MNDHELLEDLDRRAGAAAADLRAHASSRPRPAFDGTSRPVLPAPLPIGHRPSRRPLLAVAAVAVVLLALVGGLALRPDGSAEDAAGPAPGAPRPYAATSPPDGFELVGAFQLPDTATAPVDPDDGSADVGSVPLHLYGPGDDRPLLGVAVGWSLNGELDGTAIELGDGRPAVLSEALGIPGTALSFELEGRPVLVLSQDLDRATLIDVATRARFDGDRIEVAETSLPDGWRLLGTEPDLLGALSPMTSTRSGGGRAQNGVIYAQRTEGSLSYAAVGSSAGDELGVNVLRLISTDVREVVVRGHRGLIGTAATSDEEPGLRTVAWLERPGELIRVSGYELSEDDLLRMAESVEPLSEDAWKDLLRRSRLGELAGPDGGPPLEVIGRGSFADGTEWVLRAPPAEDQTGGASLSLSVDTGPGGGGSSSGSSTETGETELRGFGGLTVLHQTGRHFLTGDLGRDVASVELRRTDGTTLAEATIIEGEGLRAWVAELTVEEADVVALDEQGHEIDRIGLADHGDTSSHSGDISGGGSPTTTVRSSGPGE